MAQTSLELDQRAVCCSICLCYLDDPVVIPCGHSYCMDCIKEHWDSKTGLGCGYCCPQCRQTFSTRPELPNSADVFCDICVGLKPKATAFCLVCLISFCEKHIQPHVEAQAYKKHKLVQPSRSLRENICSDHNELKKLFCRSDQQLICYLCSVEKHKGHITVSAAAETSEKK